MHYFEEINAEMIFLYAATTNDTNLFQLKTLSAGMA